MSTPLKTDSIGIWQFGPPQKKKKNLTSGDENPPKLLYFLILKKIISLFGDISPVKKEGCF
jgi:hypothetical protein